MLAIFMLIDPTVNCLIKTLANNFVDTTFLYASVGHCSAAIVSVYHKLVLAKT